MILVTGNAGYIGSHCTIALLEKGYKVIGFDNLSTGHMETVKELSEIGKENFKFYKGDLQNYEDINRVLKEEKIETIIHFAAASLVGESVIDPIKYYKNNVLGTLNLLIAMKENNVDKIVFSSTAATYGEPNYIPIDEHHPQNPINPYGKSKLMIEKMMDDFDRAYKIKSVRLRYFNVAGADTNSRVGEWHNVETHLIPNILKSTFKDGKTFQMFGDDYDTKDGTCLRDYVNVEDLADAHILALEYLKNGGKTDFFNLGTNEGNTVKEVFDECKKVTGKDIKVELKGRREGDPAKLVADNKKAKEILKWLPEKSLSDSILSAYAWEEKLQNLI